MDAPVTRAAILAEATRCVTQDRNRAYGPPEDAFAALAMVKAGLSWARGGREPGAVDACLDLAALKLVRAAANPAHLDNFVDGAGYFACAGEIAAGAGDVPGSLPADARARDRDAALAAAIAVCDHVLEELARLDWDSAAHNVAVTLRRRIGDLRGVEP